VGVELDLLPQGKNMNWVLWTILGPNDMQQQVDGKAHNGALKNAPPNIMKITRSGNGWDM
jgi:hypothetical protein